MQAVRYTLGWLVKVTPYQFYSGQTIFVLSGSIKEINSLSLVTLISVIHFNSSKVWQIRID